MQVAMFILLSDGAQFRPVFSQEIDGSFNRKFSILMHDIIPNLPRAP
jgi:hypothetical protein